MSGTRQPDGARVAPPGAGGQRTHGRGARRTRRPAVSRSATGLAAEDRRRDRSTVDRRQSPASGGSGGCAADRDHRSIQKGRVASLTSVRCRELRVFDFSGKPLAALRALPVPEAQPQQELDLHALRRHRSPAELRTFFASRFPEAWAELGPAPPSDRWYSPSGSRRPISPGPSHLLGGRSAASSPSPSGPARLPRCALLRRGGRPLYSFSSSHRASLCLALPTAESPLADNNWTNSSGWLSDTALSEPGWHGQPVESFRHDQRPACPARVLI